MAKKNKQRRTRHAIMDSAGNPQSNQGRHNRTMPSAKAKDFTKVKLTRAWR